MTTSKMSSGIKFSGWITRSEFEIRSQFIRTRIKKKLLREEVAFLMGRAPNLLRGFEEMKPGIRLNADDASVLSLILEEDLQYLAASDNLDTDPQYFIGIKTDHSGLMYYELNHSWIDIDGGVTEINETTLLRIMPGEASLVKRAIKELGRLLKAGFFDQTQSGLDIWKLLQRTVDPDIRALVVRKAVHYHLVDKKLICFKNKEGMFRYHRLIS